MYNKVMVIDTSSSAASIAVFENGILIGESGLHSKTTHSIKFMPLLDALMKQLELKISDIDAYYVCEGPGSFTGVRIGISTVKGFAQPFQTPIYTFTSMYLLASAMRHVEGLIVPMIDAKRSEVYYGVYKWADGSLVCLEEGVASVAEIMQQVKDQYAAERYTWIGDGVLNYREMLSFESNDAVGTAYDAAQSAGKLALEGYSGAPQSAFTVKANYMRKSQAERDVK